jgi:ABC-type dipeptide/oligopeptide/nickel transport system permease component
VAALSPRFFARRVAAALVLVFAVTSGALLLAQLAPGDYFSQFSTDPAVAAGERHRLGLDRPVPEQYAAWIWRSLRFDLGESLQYHQPVIALVRERAANTVSLAAVALVVATLLGIPAGVITGSRTGGWLRAAIRALSSILLSVPSLVTSLVLLTIAARTGWLPVSGMGGPEHFVIPALALALPLAAVLERLQSDGLREALLRPNIAAARARGLPLRRLVWHHAWRQSLSPLLALYGIIAGSLFSGSFAVELVTSWPGLGLLMRGALMARDTYLIAGCAAAGSIFLAAGILAADVAHAVLDPRVAAEAEL